jgi:hypothetical protein
MKKISVLLSTLVLCFCLFSGGIPFSGCTKKEVIYRDTTINILKDTTIGKQTYIHLGGATSIQSTTPWVSYYIIVPQFNMNNFANVDSVVLVANGYATQGAGSLLVKLYDITDSTAVGGSTVTITTPEHAGDPLGTIAGFYPYLSSRNFVDSLPKKPIDLSIQISTTDNSTFGLVIDSYLILYRK